VAQKQSVALLNTAKARAEGMPDAPDQGDGIDPRLKNMQAAADVQDTLASARHKNAQADRADMETFIAPHQAEHDATMDHLEHNQTIQRDRQAYERQMVQSKEPV
jgi:hypothetical protein